MLWAMDVRQYILIPGYVVFVGMMNFNLLLHMLEARGKKD